MPVFCSISVSSRGSGPSISQITLGMWPTARVCEDGVEGDERWVKIVAKLELPNPNKLGDYIGEGSARLEGNRDIKSLHSLQIFPKRDHTGRMLFVVVANDFCWSRGTSIGVEAQFGARFLNSFA
jgi:hypothetical protein